MYLRAVDATGYGALFQMRSVASVLSAGARVVELTAGSGITITPDSTDPEGYAASKFEFVISAALTAPLTGEYSWEIRYTDLNGEKWDPFAGTATVEASVPG